MYKILAERQYMQRSLINTDNQVKTTGLPSLIKRPQCFLYAF